MFLILWVEIALQQVAVKCKIKALLLTVGFTLLLTSFVPAVQNLLKEKECKDFASESAPLGIYLKEENIKK